MLEDLEMSVSLGCHLRQMGDDKHLHVDTHVAHHCAHFICYLTRHAGVDLVKDNSGQIHFSGEDGLEAQHHPRHFAARSHICEGLHTSVLVEGTEKLHIVLPGRSEFRCRQARLERKIRKAERARRFSYEPRQAFGTDSPALSESGSHPL